MPKRNTGLPRATVVLAALLIVPAAHAFNMRPDAVMVQGGMSPDHTAAAAVGLVWDWDWLRQRRSLLTAQTEFIVSHWRAESAGGGNFTVQQLAVVPVLRMRLGRGRSPWYLELGVGASWLTRDYVTADKAFSTRWNFHDVVGGGYKFGAAGGQEIGLRYVHVSNLGIRRPNPGEDFVLLRYSVKF